MLELSVPWESVGLSSLSPHRSHGDMSRKSTFLWTFSAVQSHPANALGLPSPASIPIPFVTVEGKPWWLVDST